MSKDEVHIKNLNPVARAKFKATCTERGKTHAELLEEFINLYSGEPIDTDKPIHKNPYFQDFKKLILSKQDSLSEDWHQVALHQAELKKFYKMSLNPEEKGDLNRLYEILQYAEESAKNKKKSKWEILLPQIRKFAHNEHRIKQTSAPEYVICCKCKKIFQKTFYGIPTRNVFCGNEECKQAEKRMYPPNSKYGHAAVNPHEASITKVK